MRFRNIHEENPMTKKVVVDVLLTDFNQ